MNTSFKYFPESSVKQSNLRRDGLAPIHKVATLRNPPAELANESHADSPHSDSSGTDCSLPHGIAMLIDILAREALKVVIAEHRELQARNDLRQETAQSGKRNEPAVAVAGVIKTKSCLAAKPAPETQ
jgi:hypothetical protein